MFLLNQIEETSIPWSVVRDYLEYDRGHYLRSLTVPDEEENQSLRSIVSAYGPALRELEEDERDPVVAAELRRRLETWSSLHEEPEGRTHEVKPQLLRSLGILGCPPILVHYGCEFRSPWGAVAVHSVDQNGIQWSLFAIDSIM